MRFLRAPLAGLHPEWSNILLKFQAVPLKRRYDLQFFAPRTAFPRANFVYWRTSSEEQESGASAGFMDLWIYGSAVAGLC